MKRALFTAAIMAVTILALGGNARANINPTASVSTMFVKDAKACPKSICPTKAQADRLNEIYSSAERNCKTLLPYGQSDVDNCMTVVRAAGYPFKALGGQPSEAPKGTDNATAKRTKKAPVNKAPVIGLITALQEPLTVTVDAVVEDDGSPNPPAKITRDLTIVSGPGAGTLRKKDDTLVLDLEKPGKYELRLSASDGELTTTASFTVNVPDKVQQPGCTAGVCLPLPESIGCHLRFWVIVTLSVVILLVILIFGLPKIGKRKFRGVLGYYKAWKQAERARGAVGTPPPIPTDKK